MFQGQKKKIGKLFWQKYKWPGKLSCVGWNGALSRRGNRVTKWAFIGENRGDRWNKLYCNNVAVAGAVSRVGAVLSPGALETCPGTRGQRLLFFQRGAGQRPRCSLAGEDCEGKSEVFLSCYVLHGFTMKSQRAPTSLRSQDPLIQPASLLHWFFPFLTCSDVAGDCARELCHRGEEWGRSRMHSTAHQMQCSYRGGYRIQPSILNQWHVHSEAVRTDVAGKKGRK